MKILIIEDEPELIKVLESFLVSENFLVEKAMDYASGVEKVSLYEYDCILLDINLPGGTGLKILEKMKENGVVGNTIIISARDSVDDKIAGLDLGADDYLTKPFHLAELHARIKALLRRKMLGGTEHLEIGNMYIDYRQRSVSVGGNLLKLNRKEYDILVFFSTNMNRLITKETLAEHVWGDNIDSADSFDFIYAQVKNLRKKLKDNGADVNLENVYGIGYKMTL
ncbi:response regulator transcription factor [Dysgonomonas sp. 25]|uniref:response regulator transcription factor n=1 Tax=Dysgonomonas sp. 25 TaxID=2302933 RepID=UPI0013D63DBB|nr:response regulator transcription factor [Dysgonomonas sp. 25]NDV70360.1 DNA-binding response regulator [Dysgonomonas sp. 25]